MLAGNISSCVINIVFGSLFCKFPNVVFACRKISHLEIPANGQAKIILTELLEVFISEISLWKQYQTPLSVIKPSI